MVVLVGAVRFGCGAPPAENTADAAAELERRQTEIRRLDQENARLVAEVQRLRQTLTESRARATARPRAEASLPPAPAAAAAHWIETAVANGDLEALPQLEAAALRNDVRALRALALLSSGDGATALLRVWASGQLTADNLLQATRWLGATVEINPNATDWVQSLTAGDRSTARLITAAAEGLADTQLGATLTGKVDYVVRLRLLNTLIKGIEDAALIEQLGKLYNAVLAELGAGSGAAPEPRPTP